MSVDATRDVPVGRTVTVDVPASSANLGPGFDCLGLALNWRDSYRIEVIESGVQVAVNTGREAPGFGGAASRRAVSEEAAAEKADVAEPAAEEPAAEELLPAGEAVPADQQNLVIRSVRHGLSYVGCQAPGLRLTGQHTIPHGRGLGSSSAAIVAGLAAAQGLVAGARSVPESGAFEPADWLELADRIEGHPDNVAAALFGGLVLVYRGESGVPQAARLSVHPEVAALALVPDQPLSTEQARGLLPAAVPHDQAAANSARAALLVHALTADPDLLFEATQDRLHQAHRAPAMPASAELWRALRSQGIPAVMSGSGPTVLVLGQIAQLEAAATVSAACGFCSVQLSIDVGVRVAAVCG